jgi:NAD(P)-dependent dehydrogenase (short-subunit alcohol dehydrogenase family)
MCQQIVQKAVDELGGVDVLINNAAYQMSLDEGIESLTTEQLMRTYTTNVFAMFWLCKAALQHMEAGASIINTSVDPGLPALAPADRLRVDQGRDRQLHQGSRVERRERGIRVNTVAPGPIWTPLIPATMPPEKVESFGQDTPLGRPGSRRSWHLRTCSSRRRSRRTSPASASGSPAASRCRSRAPPLLPGLPHGRRGGCRRRRSRPRW